MAERTGNHSGESSGRRTPGTSATARQVALRSLVEHARRFPELHPHTPDTSGLDQRDAALARAIHDAVIRRWLTLRAVIDPRLGMPFDHVEPKLKAVLLAGAAQILLLDRIPPHAAVSESVAWAKRHIRAKAGGLVNAVLRRINDAVVCRDSRFEDRQDQILLPDGRAITLSEPFLPEDPIDRLAIQASLPVSIIRRWADTRGVPDARDAALQTLCLPPTVLNVECATAPVEHTTSHSMNGSAVFTGTPNELSDLLSRRTDVWVQDAGSASAVRCVRDLVSPGLIVDLCAGRGTKTRQLAAAFPGARIVASDTDRARMQELTRVFLHHERVSVMPIGDVLLHVAGQADLVLLDVPCSNSGVFARRPEAKYRFGRDQTRRLSELQRQLLADAVPMLSARGHVLYSTCSLEPEEDAAPLAWASEWHGMSIVRSELIWPQGCPGDPASRYHDGSFFALLARR